MNRGWNIVRGVKEGRIGCVCVCASGVWCECVYELGMGCRFMQSPGWGPDVGLGG